MKGSACGKLILFGEHAVVYGQPAIAVPLKGLRLEIKLKNSDTDKISTQEELEEQDKARILEAFLISKKETGIKGAFEITINSKIPLKARLGSSAALCVATIRALKSSISPGETARIAYEMEKIFHGNPSGIDTTVVTYEKPIFFIKGKGHEFFRIKKPLMIILADTGKRTITKQVVEEVWARMDKEPEKYQRIMAEIGQTAIEGRKALEGGDYLKLTRLVNRNQELLRDIGVSSPEIEQAIKNLLLAGADAAKLTGAGVGGCVFAVCSRDIEKVAEAAGEVCKKVVQITI